MIYIVECVDSPQVMQVDVNVSPALHPTMFTMNVNNETLQNRQQGLG